MQSSKASGRYLGSSSIRALASSVALVSSVLGFEIVEVWSEGSEEGTYHCTYVHAEEGIVERYPNIITGYYPQHKRKHMLSPAVNFQVFCCHNHCILIAFYSVRVVMSASKTIS